MFFFNLCCGNQPRVTEPSADEILTARQQLNQKYTLTDKVLGEGGFAYVKEAHRKGCNDLNNSYAVKIVNKTHLKKKALKDLQREVDTLQNMEHSNIIKFYDCYDGPKRMYIVTELMSGGELFDRICKKTYYTEKEARDVCKIFLEAIAYCHEHKIAHRDLKPENLLLKSPDDDLDIKIADFGFAKKAKSDHSLSTRCGTPEYASPEIIKGEKYGTKVDMWSVGVIMYILLAGYQPFYSEDMSQLYVLIKIGSFEFHEKFWGNISNDAKDLISKLLTVNPSVRYSAIDALNSKWIKSDYPQNCHLADNFEELKKFNAKRKLKAAALATLATIKFKKVSTLVTQASSDSKV